MASAQQVALLGAYLSTPEDILIAHIEYKIYFDVPEKLLSLALVFTTIGLALFMYATFPYYYAVIATVAMIGFWSIFYVMYLRVTWFYKARKPINFKKYEAKAKKLIEQHPELKGRLIQCWKK